MQPNQQEIYYGIQGERHGPVSPEDIRELVRSGQLKLTDYLWDDERDDWVPVGQYPQLRDLGASDAPPSESPFGRAYEGEAWGEPSASPPVAVRYGGFGIRLLAHVIDSVALFVPLSFWAVLSPLDFEAMEGLDPVELLGGPIPGQETESLIFYLGAMILEWLYRSIFESSAWQATVGKRVLGLRVTDAEGRRLGFLRASVRHWSKLLSQFVFYFGFVMIALTERHQGLHDKVADTYVERSG